MVVVVVVVSVPVMFLYRLNFRAHLPLLACTSTVVLFMKHLLLLECHICWSEWLSRARQIGVT
jgi:hypothetical protein